MKRRKSGWDLTQTEWCEEGCAVYVTRCQINETALHLNISRRQLIIGRHVHVFWNCSLWNCSLALNLRLDNFALSSARKSVLQLVCFPSARKERMLVRKRVSASIRFSFRQVSLHSRQSRIDRSRFLATLLPCKSSTQSGWRCPVLDPVSPGSTRISSGDACLLFCWRCMAWERLR